MATLYTVRNWKTHFEVADSRKVDGPLKWVPVPTATDGYAFSALSMEKDKCDLLAAWHLMLGIAAKRPKEERGSLSRDGRPLTADDLEMITRFPARIFDRAFEFFASERIGWLSVEQIDATTTDSTTPIPSGQDGSASGQSPATGYDRIGEDRIRQESAAVAASAQTDAEWLASLKTNPAYTGIDIERERAKCETWCANNKKAFSRKRFVNWLNRIEQPMKAGGGSARFGGLF